MERRSFLLRAGGQGVSCFVAIALLLAARPARAQYQPIPNYNGIGAGQQFRGDINNHLSGVTPIAPRLVSLPFSVLNTTPENDGQVYWCRDCAQAPICTSGGQGAVAVGAGGQWTCVLGPIVPGSPPVGIAGNDLTGNYPNPIVHSVMGGQTPVTTLNGINALSPAAGNYSMGGKRITALGGDVTTGDALSRSQSSLSSLQPPSAAFNMNGQTFQSLGAATTGGEPIVGGVVNTVNNTQVSINNRLNPITYANARGDAVICLSGGSLSATTFSVGGGACGAFLGFTAADVGKYITISGAGPGGAAYQGTIAGFVSSSSVTLSPAPTANVTNQTFTYGTDNTTPFQNTETACELLGSTIVDIPPGNYITGPVQLGNPATAVASGSSTQGPSCWGTLGAGRYSTVILAKPGAPYAFQRHNTAGVTIQSIDFDGALRDGLIVDQPIGLVDLSWYAGAPSTANNIRDLALRYFDGEGLNAALNNDANIGEIWSVPQWDPGQTQTGAITTCTESTTSACGTGLTATCNIASNRFVAGEWATIAGDSVSGYNMTSAVPLVAVTANSIRYCAYSSSLGTGNGGTATLVPITIDVRGAGGQMWLHDFISAGQPGLMVAGSQTWHFSNFGIYGGLQVAPIDNSSAELDGGQLLNGDSTNNQIHIEAVNASATNASMKSLLMKDIWVSGPVTGVASTLFDGRFFNGVTMQGGVINGTNGTMNIFGTIVDAAPNMYPRFNFDGVALQGATFNPPGDVEWRLKGSCEAAGTGPANSTLTGGSVIGSPVSCNGATQINMETAYSAAGTPVPGPGGGVCSAIINSREPICALDTSTAGCPAGTSYVSGGTAQCRLFCSGTTWKDTGAPC